MDTGWGSGVRVRRCVGYQLVLLLAVFVSLFALLATTHTSTMEHVTYVIMNNRRDLRLVRIVL